MAHHLLNTTLYLRALETGLETYYTTAMFNKKNARKKTLFELEEDYEKGNSNYAQHLDLEDPISDHDGPHSPWQNIQEEYMRLIKFKSVSATFFCSTRGITPSVLRDEIFVINTDICSYENH